MGLRDGGLLLLLGPPSRLRIPFFLLLLVFGVALTVFGCGRSSRDRLGRGLGLRGVAGLWAGVTPDAQPGGLGRRSVVPEGCHSRRGGLGGCGVDGGDASSRVLDLVGAWCCAREVRGG